MSYRNLTVDQGSDFNITILILNPDNTPVNIAGYVFSGNIKASYYSNTVIDTLSLSVVDAPNGNLSISYAAANSANIDASVAYVYDVTYKTPSNTINRVINGILRLNPGVTGINPITVIGG